MDTAKLTPARIVILAAGAATLVGSFLPFGEAEYDFGGLGGSGSVSFSAWSGDHLFAISIVPVLLGLVMALQVGLSSFTATALPERVLGLGWPQIHVVCGLTAALMMVAFMVRESGLDKGLGLFLMLLGGIGLAVGAVLLGREPQAAAGMAGSA